MKDPTHKTAKFIAAEKLFVDPADLALDNQRHPEERKDSLVKLFGSRGQHWRDELAGAITVKERPNGLYAIKDGGGRWWAVMNLLREPRKELLCVIVPSKTNDLEAFSALNAGKHVAKGQLFMAKGNDPKNKYEHRVCTVLKDHEFTTVPARKWRTISTKAVCFSYDLGNLNTTLTIIKERWSIRLTKTGKKIHDRVDGYVIVGLSAFIFLYGNKPGFDDRLNLILGRNSLKEILEGARELLPARKEHARQWGVAVCRQLIHLYNHGTSKVPKVNPEDILKIQKFSVKHENHVHIHRDVWEFRKVVK